MLPTWFRKPEPQPKKSQTILIDTSSKQFTSNADPHRKKSFHI